MTTICGLTADELYDLIRPYDFNYSHAVSVLNYLYRKRSDRISEYVNIPGKLRDVLSLYTQPGFLKYVVSKVSADKTVKYLFQTESGKKFESVYIPDGKRHTVCVSTQSGCRMGCAFCQSGKYGFHGNLTAGEIVSQVISIPFAEKVTHVVFMGMGEPMDNFENVLKASKIFTAQWGLALSPRHVTVSTAGIRPGLEMYLEQSDCNLALSLYSPFSEERQLVVPVEKRYPAGDIIKLMKDFKIRKGRRLSIAYVMIGGLNDSEDHLQKLISLLKGSEVRVNLLPYHPAGDDPMRSSSSEKMQYFKHTMVISGISASVRKSRGSDISAACGLLAAGIGLQI